MTIRLAGDGDLPTILEIYNEAVLTSTASYDLAPETLESRRAWFASHERLGMPVFVAEADGDVVGWSSLSPFHTRLGYKYCVEDSVYVAADHQGRGAGKLLLAQIVSAARSMGLHTIIAGIDSERVASIRLHASFGFIEVGRLRQVGRKFDRWLDCIYMELLLE